MAGDKEPLGLVAPFALWALAFVLLYAGHGLACGIGVRPGHFDLETRWALTALLVTFLVAHGGLAWWFWRRLRVAEEPPLQFIRRAAFTLAVAAMATTFWTGLPVLTLSICT
jgi:hypothetical protein